MKYAIDSNIISAITICHFGLALQNKQSWLSRIIHHRSKYINGHFYYEIVILLFLYITNNISKLVGSDIYVNKTSNNFSKQRIIFGIFNKRKIIHEKKLLL